MSVTDLDTDTQQYLSLFIVLIKLVLRIKPVTKQPY